MSSGLGLPGTLFSAAMGVLFFVIAGSLLVYPIVGLGTLLPLPILWAYLRHGGVGGLVAALTGGLVHLFVAHLPLGGVQAWVGGSSGWPVTLTSAAVQGVIPALLMGAALGANAPAGIVMTAGASGSLGGQIALLSMLKLLGADQAKLLAESVRQSAQYLPAEMTRAQGTELQAYVEGMVQALQTLFPAILALTTFASIGITYWLARRLFGNLGYEMPTTPPFRQWRLPALVGWFWLLTFLAWGSGEFGRRLAANVSLILTTAYLIQGSAVGHFFLSQRLPRLVSGSVLGLVALSPVLWLLTLLGVGDAVFDFRRLGPNANR